MNHIAACSGSFILRMCQFRLSVWHHHSRFHWNQISAVSSDYATLGRLLMYSSNMLVQPSFEPLWRIVVPSSRGHLWNVKPHDYAWYFTNTLLQKYHNLLRWLIVWLQESLFLYVQLTKVQVCRLICNFVLCCLQSRTLIICISKNLKFKILSSLWCWVD